MSHFSSSLNVCLKVVGKKCIQIGGRFLESKSHVILGNHTKNKLDYNNYHYVQF
jgi:hypothetical protein